MKKDRLVLDITPSILFCLLLAASHLMAILGVLYGGLSLPYQAALSLAVIASFLFCLFRYALLRDPLSVTNVIYRNERWTLELVNGEKITADLQSPVFVVSFLVVLNYCDAMGRKFPVALFPDSVDGAQLRHSRIFFRFGAY
jgi:hypothetical protein